MLSEKFHNAITHYEVSLALNRAQIDTSGIKFILYIIFINNI